MDLYNSTEASFILWYFTSQIDKFQEVRFKGLSKFCLINTFSPVDARCHSPWPQQISSLSFTAGC